mgnify:CR=1 FL=1
MEFGVLGPLEVRHDGGPIAVGGAKQRRVVAALALQPGRVVSLSRLVDAVWDGEPPATARKQIQNTVSALRRTPVGPALAAVGPGYVLQVPAEQVDAGRFERCLAEAQAARTRSDLTHAAGTLRAGLAIWRGPALAGVGGRVLSAAAGQLEERRLSAVIAWAEISLELGSHGAVAHELGAELDRYPLCEPLAGLLMVALYRAGRAAEALVCFERIRRTIAEDLGVDPGSELRDRYHRILAADPVLDHRPRPLPRNYLPRDVGHFTGRSAELDRLISVAGSGGVTVIQAIDGMSGVGKTAVAVHAAHRLAGRFRDGQLFVDLHGHTAGRDPLTSGEALDVLLRAVGVSDARIPKSLDEKAAMWRGELAGRRVLVVLDNAWSSGQVEPLMPGAARCAVMITSRRRLTGLSGAAVLSLDILPPDDAAALFRRIAGPDRRAAEPEEVGRVVRLCGRLPLAISIAAARFRVRPQWKVLDLIERLSDDRGRARLLQSDDRGITAAFALSYQHLADAEQRMFRLLGLHPGADIDVFAAAALAGLPADEAEHLLDALCDMHLLTAHLPGRYRLHDLVRDFARAAVDAEEPVAHRSAARDRLLDYYVHVTRLAIELDNPSRPHLGPSPRHPPVAVPRLSRTSEIRSWVDAEHATLVAVARLAAQHRADDGWQLPRNVGSLLYENGRHSASLEVFTIALAACGPGTPSAVRAACLLDVSLMHRVLGQYRLALDFLEQGTADAADAGDHDGIARSLIHKADLSNLVGSYTDAVAYATRSMELNRERGEVWREAVALTVLMDALSRLGRDREAIEAADRAALPLDGFANLRQASAVLSRRGTAHSRLGEHDTAIRLLRQSVDLARQGEDRRFEADYLHRLAEATRRSGSPHAALDHANEALAILDDIADPVDLAETHNALGAIHHDLHEDEVALTHYRRTLAITADVDYRIARAQALDGAGRCLAALGRPDAAMHRHQALTVYAEIGVPAAS